MLNQPIQELPPEEAFIGAGIYALYYIGDFAAYNMESEINKRKENPFTRPIYVGKAVPKGSRKGGFCLDGSPGTVLFSRLTQHAKSIKETSNLNLVDFRCRYLVVDDIWIPLAESLLIEMFSPIWNKVVDGFGIHTPGRRRFQQQKSLWDVLHPGRYFEKHLTKNTKTQDGILALIDHFYTENK